MIAIYTTNNKANDINKILTNERVLDAGKIRESELDVLSPSFIVKTSEIAGNYIFISELNRYYFIDSVERIDHVHSRLTCEVDVLYTYKDIILATNAICIRQPNSNKYYSSFEVESRKTRTTLNFDGSAFNTNGSYVLTTVVSG